MSEPLRVLARAPGRVNLIGDHTDYTGGLVVPMAIDRETIVEGFRTGHEIMLTSRNEKGAVTVPLDVTDPMATRPEWGRYVAGVVATLRPTVGFHGAVTSDLPIGAGLSSSASLELAVALALGAPVADSIALAQLCQAAEHAAVGVPSGIMDQLVVAAGVEDHALVIDCDTLTFEPVPIPTGLEVTVVHSGASRALATSAYAERVGQCAEAEAQIGSLRHADRRAADEIVDPVVRARARHVVTENARAVAFVEALRSDDLDTAGRLMVESHHSLRDDYEVSTAKLDTIVDELLDTQGVFGARLTGAGFGGCVVAIGRPGALVGRGWTVRAAHGASVSTG